MKNDNDFLASMWDKVKDAEYVQAQKKRSIVSIVKKVLTYTCTLLSMVIILYCTYCIDPAISYIAAPIILSAAYFVEFFYDTDRKDNHELSNHY